MSQAEVQELEISIEEARKYVQRGKEALALSDIPEFKRLVLEGYFVEEASRLALLFSDPQLSDEQREYVHRDLIGVGAFKRYLSTIVQQGRIASNEIDSMQDTLEEIRAEEYGESEGLG